MYYIHIRLGGGFNPAKNICQNASSLQVGSKKKCLKPQPSVFVCVNIYIYTGIRFLGFSDLGPEDLQQHFCKENLQHTVYLHLFCNGLEKLGAHKITSSA